MLAEWTLGNTLCRQLTLQSDARRCMLLRKLFQWTCHYSNSLTDSVPEQADSHTRQQREALLRSRRRRHGGAVDLASTRSVQDATASLAQALHAGDGAIHAAARELRRSVSGAQQVDVAALAQATVPLLVRVLHLRQGTAEARAAVLEASWAITNLAADEHSVVEAVLLTAPLLIAHLAGTAGLQVAEQCAWALGNMAGDCSAFSATLAANGAVLPLAKLLLRAARASSASARTAAWALSNLLWGAPGQAGHLLDVPGFRDGLTAAVRSSNAQLREEAAWLLAFICAGPEAHMHAMVKHGAAVAAAEALCQEVAGAPGSTAAVAQQELDEKQLCAVVPLLRCLGNMATSRAAAEVVCRKGCTTALVRCATSPGLQGEARWVLENVGA